MRGRAGRCGQGRPSPADGDLLRAFRTDETLPHIRAEERALYAPGRAKPARWSWCGPAIRAAWKASRRSARTWPPGEAVAALLTVGVAAAVLAVTGIASRRALDKRRIAAWDADWSQVGPQWTGWL